MEDLERYGDYNELDEEEDLPRKNILGSVIKWVAIALIAALFISFGVRMFIFEYYPPEMKRLYFNDSLSEFYNERDGEIAAKTQALRAPYDHAEEGNFFADHLIVIPELGQLQICMRYNVSVGETLCAVYGLESFDPEDFSQFSFRLCRDGIGESEETVVLGELSDSFSDSFAMYRYTKLVFDGVSLFGGEEDVEWLRLEIFVRGIEKPFMIPIYENNEAYSGLDDYDLSRGERP